MLDAALIQALNHLLGGASWARARLKPFAGRQAHFAMPPLQFDLAVGVEGLFEAAMFEAARGGKSPDVAIFLPADTPFLLPQGIDKVMAVARVEGNAEFATELSFILRNLHWDVEEDLSKVVGDIAAHRLVQGAARCGAWQQQVKTHLTENLAEYLAHENPLLIANAEFAILRDDLTRLNAALTRLETRLARLTR